MKSFILLPLFMLCILYSSSAQEVAPPPAPPSLEEDQLVFKDTTYWIKSFSGGLNFNQGAFSSNWKAGGVNSVAFGGILAGTANYLNNRFSWDSEVELLYGIVRNQGEETRKNNDRIFLDTKVGYLLSKKWGTYASLNFLSQFAEGFDFSEPPFLLISDFMSPAFLTSSIGMEYKPNDEFALRIGPLSPRLTFVTNRDLFLTVPGNYGVPIGETVRTEWLALQIFASWNKDLAENLNLKMRYQMFSNYEKFNLKETDHRLDLTLTAKITNLINVTFTSLNLYDFDQDSNIQFSQGLALGILYKIGNKE
ncbi:DUF3078 domain-containing protein [Pararhodonellum marinum]|uniref:DUF3078 domain-containing protein n=1 Tax=Pararhodonellum marinum TaxID=2755358 RepID=UPI00188FB80A|nr:DUF3078 domain-containing protein [Pararhodonellum marinum]